MAMPDFPRARRQNMACGLHTISVSLASVAIGSETHLHLCLLVPHEGAALPRSRQVLSACLGYSARGELGCHQSQASPTDTRVLCVRSTCFRASGWIWSPTGLSTLMGCKAASRMASLPRYCWALFLRETPESELSAPAACSRTRRSLRGSFTSTATSSTSTVQPARCSCTTLNGDQTEQFHGVGQACHLYHFGEAASRAVVFAPF